MGAHSSLGTILFYLCIGILWAACLSAKFCYKHFLHLFWTLPVGFLSGVLGLALLSFAMGGEGILWWIVSVVVFIPLPLIWIRFR